MKHYRVKCLIQYTFTFYIKYFVSRLQVWSGVQIRNKGYESWSRSLEHSAKAFEKTVDLVLTFRDGISSSLLLDWLLSTCLYWLRQGEAAILLPPQTWKRKEKGRSNSLTFISYMSRVSTKDFRFRVLLPLVLKSASSAAVTYYESRRAGIREAGPSRCWGRRWQEQQFGKLNRQQRRN